MYEVDEGNELQLVGPIWKGKGWHLLRQMPMRQTSQTIKNGQNLGTTAKALNGNVGRPCEVLQNSILSLAGRVVLHDFLLFSSESESSLLFMHGLCLRSI